MTGLRARVVVRRERFAVDVALEVATGETVAVMGPSGAGKSTLLAALAGLERLEAGEVHVGDRIVDRVERPRIHLAPMHRGVVLLGQDPRLFPHLTARENVAFGPRVAGMSRAHARAEAEVWLARVGLRGLGDRRPGELSGGEQQRVAVARALAASPRAVLLDEPLVALDPETAAGIRAILRAELADRTVVAVTHDAVDAIALADRLLVIERGRLTQSGLVREVLAAPGTAFVASVAGVNRVMGVARNGGWQREDVHLRSADAAARRLQGTAVAAVFAPGAVRIVASLGANSWTARVARLEPTPAGVRVHTQWCAVDLPLLAAAHLEPGAELVLHVPPEHVNLLAVY